jgi:PTH1 family peptidyl-tRNA hydrolase
MALEALADLAGAARQRECCGGLAAQADGLLLFRPLRYVNRSGPAIGELLNRTETPRSGLLVLVDDMALPLGSLRLRPSGSSGGHRGLESVIAALGSQQFPRLRMGIGAPPPGVAARSYVLSAFGPEERDAVEQMIDAAARAALCWAEQGLEAAMNRYNRIEQ